MKTKKVHSLRGVSTEYFHIDTIPLRLHALKCFKCLNLHYPSIAQKTSFVRTLTEFPKMTPWHLKKGSHPSWKISFKGPPLTRASGHQIWDLCRDPDY